MGPYARPGGPLNEKRNLLVKRNADMQYRIKVIIPRENGRPPKRLTTICDTEEVRDRRLAMYKGQYLEAEIYVEEVEG